jgi:hypothetical protein
VPRGFARRRNWHEDYLFLEVLLAMNIAEYVNTYYWIVDITGASPKGVNFYHSIYVSLGNMQMLGSKLEQHKSQRLIGFLVFPVHTSLSSSSVSSFAARHLQKKQR